jgi:hypothetical protein
MTAVQLFSFGLAVFILGALGLVLVGLDAFRSWLARDEAAGAADEAAAASALPPVEA